MTKFPVRAALLLLLSAAYWIPGLLHAQIHVTAPEGRATGEWWAEPGNPGWGLVLTHSDDQTVVQHVDFDGNGDDYWQVGVGPLAGATFSADLVRTRWDPVRQRLAGQQVTGHVVLTRIDNRLADVVLSVDGVVRTTRLERIIVSTDAVVRDASGLWVNPSRPGIGLTMMSQGPVLAILALAYDETGAPRWWLAHGPNGLDGFRDLEARRYRRTCGNPCTIQSLPGGSVRVQWQDDHRIHTRLTLDGGTSAPFVDDAPYTLLTAPASGRQYPTQARPFTNRRMIEAYQRLAQVPLACTVGVDGLLVQGGTLGTRVASDPNGARGPWIAADAMADVGTFVAAVQEPVWPPQWDRVSVALFRLDATSGRAQSVSTFEPPALSPLATLVLPLTSSTDHARFLIVSDNGWSRCRSARTPTTTLSFVRVAPDGRLEIERSVQLDASVDAVLRHDDRLLVLANTPLNVADANTGMVTPTNPVIRLGAGHSLALLDTPIHLSPAGEYDRTVMSLVELSDGTTDRVDVRSLVIDGGTWLPGLDSVSIVARSLTWPNAAPAVEIQSWPLALRTDNPRGGSHVGSIDTALDDAARLHHDTQGIVIVTNAPDGAGHSAQIWSVVAADPDGPLAVTALHSIGPERQDGLRLVPKRISHDGTQTQITLGPNTTLTESSLWVADRVDRSLTEASIDQFIGRRITIDSRIELGLQRSGASTGFDARVRERRDDGSTSVGWAAPIDALRVPAITIDGAIDIDRRIGETLIATPLLQAISIHGTTYREQSIWIARLGSGSATPQSVKLPVPTLLAEWEILDPPTPSQAVERNTVLARLADRTRVRIRGEFVFMFTGAEVHSVRLPQ
ncbi:MAG: hypothetical protein IPK97_18465 [Ahniella sp.]|nr:hypothetical protein [Ahniella sp.]